MKAITLSFALALALVPAAAGQDGYDRKASDKQAETTAWEATIRGVSG